MNNRVKAEITNNMKANFAGEFYFEIEEPCPKCALHLDQHYDGIDCLCDGSPDTVYQRKIVVPWDTCKEIYKKMLNHFKENEK